MNSWLLLLLLFLLPLSSWAVSEKVFDRIDIIRTTHAGQSVRARVELTDKGFYFNSQPLPPANTIHFAPAIKALRPQPGARKPTSSCRAGMVKLIREQGKHRLSESFCLSDERSKEVYQALTFLDNQARLGILLRR